MNKDVIYNPRKPGEKRRVLVYHRLGLRNISEVVGGIIAYDGREEFLEAGKIRYVLTLKGISEDKE